MKCIIIFGPQAVGKMTVGQKLSQITNLKLFHNHMTIEMLAPIFEFGPEMWRLVNLFRQEVFTSIAKSDKQGLIFTYVWGLDIKEDWDYIESVCQIFESNGGKMYFVELEADLPTRLDRNKSANRLEHKPTKRDVEWSERDLLQTLDKHRLNSVEGEIHKENYIKINNSKLSPMEVASQIKNAFDL